MKNKLAYLGFLGFLGFAGFFGTPLMFAFFSNFVFFQYIKTVPDELFWINVRICATRSFFVFIISAKLIVVTTLILAASDNLHDYASRFAVFAFSLTTGVSDFVFLANLGYLEEKEKRSKDDEENG